VGHPAQRIERFEVDANTDTQQWISGWNFRPGDPAQVARAVVSIAGGDTVGSWVPGDNATHFPSGVAQRLPAGSRLAVEIYYRKSSVAAMTASAVDLYLTTTQGSELRHRPLQCGPTVLQQRLDALAVTPSAAAAGESVEVVARTRDGSVQPLVVIPQFDPGNQLTYRFRQPVRLLAGDAITVRSSASGCAALLEFTEHPSARVRAPRR
jgi:hypothetical protein